MAAAMLALPLFAQKAQPHRFGKQEVAQRPFNIQRLGDFDRATANELIANLRGQRQAQRRAGEQAEDVIYFQDFNNQLAGLSMMTIVDANLDESTWDWYGSRARCAYHRQNSADDWMITEAIQLEAGRSYDFSIKAQSYSERYGERFEVKLGNAAQPEAMTIQIIEPTEIKSETKQEFTAQRITVPQDGAYYIGVHGISDPDRMYLFVDDIKLSGGASTAMPAGVTDVTFTPDAQGGTSVDISFKAPTTQIDGTPLTQAMNIRVIREDEVVKNFQDVAPGTQLSFTDQVSGNSDYEYIFIASVGEADGEIVKLTTYVGLDTPAELQDIRVADHSTSIDFQFAPISNVGTHGGVVVPADVQVDLYSAYINELSGGINLFELEGTTSDNHISIRSHTNEGEPGIDYWALIPWNLQGNGPTSWVPVFVGKPDAMPYFENFKGRKFKNFWTYDISTSSVVLNYSGFNSDGDGASIVFHTVSGGEWGFIESGKIDIRGAQNPTLSIDVQGEGEGNTLVVYAIGSDGIYKQVATLPVGEEFTTHSISLTDFKGSDFIRLRLMADFQTPGAVFLDNICALDLLERNVALTEIVLENAPAIGEECSVLVTATNYGSQVVEAFTIDLYANGRLVASQPGSFELETMKSCTEVMTFTPTVFLSGELEIEAEVIFEGDQKESDNVISTSAYIVKSGADQPQGVNVTMSDGKPLLSWDLADGAARTVTDDFESYTPWEIVTDEPYNTTTLGQWTLYNGDQSYAGPLWDAFEMPSDFQTFAFVVTNMDYVFGPEENNHMGHSGKQFLSAFYGYDLETMNLETFDMDYAESNDWLISPELSGQEQTISFWYQAPSPSGAMIEYVYIQGSKTDRNINSFKPLSELLEFTTSEYEDDWRECRFTIPAGIKYFAINRNNGPLDGMWLMIDDITFDKRTLIPVSYNIYVDEELVANVAYPATSWSYEGDRTSHDFSITAVYADGSVSEPVTVFFDPSGISHVVSDAAPAQTYTATGILTDAQHRGFAIRRAADGRVTKVIR